MIDGQLKITVDCVLALDAINKREGLKILVIGASSPLGALSGCAYEAMASMVTRSEFHLYDPYTVNCSYEIDSNRFSHFRAKFDYSNVHGFDLVCDDAWVQDQDHDMFDPDGIVYSAPNYTVKHFPWEQNGVGNVYYQAFKTNGFESRIVSRKIDFDYRYLPLGHCSGCVELKYLLKQDYGSEFYKRFMSFHSLNCLTGERHTIGDNTDLGLDMLPLDVSPSEVYIKTFYRLAWDVDVSRDLRVLPMNYSAIRGSRVLVSHERCLTYYVARNAIQVYKFAQGLWFCLKFQEGVKELAGPNLEISYKDKRTGNLIVSSCDEDIDDKNYVKKNNYEISFKGRVTSIGLRKDVRLYCIRHGIVGSISNHSLDKVVAFMRCTSLELSSFFSWIRSDGPPGLRDSLISVLVSDSEIKGDTFVISDIGFQSRRKFG